jgi:chemotaxis protein MotB
MRRKKKVDQGCPLWMMTFGDCMSLLVTFFVMLIAFSNLEEAQLMEVLGAMKGSLGVSPDMANRESPDSVHYERATGVSETKQWLSLDELSAILPDTDMALRRYGRPRVGAQGAHVIVRLIDEGLVFVVDAASLFEQGGTDFKPASDALLHRIGGFIEGLTNEVQIVAIIDESGRVEGQGYSTPWGLGIFRASLLLDWFTTLTDSDMSRYGIGVRSSSSLWNAGADTSLSTQSPDASWPERIEISVRGARSHVDRSPDEIVAVDDWG